MTCPVCKAPGSADMGSVRGPKQPGRLSRFTENRVRRCRRCGLLFVCPTVFLDQADFAEMYVREYFRWNNRFWQIRQRREIRQRLGILSRLHGRASSFLDIGCGRGDALAEAAERGLETTGIDVSDNLRRGPAELRFLRGRLHELIERENLASSFDLAYMNSVLEHVEDPCEFMRDVFLVLRPGGVAYIGVPKEGSLRNRFGGLLRRLITRRGVCGALPVIRPPYHLWGFTRKSVKLLASSVGFDVAETHIRAGLIDLLRNPPLSRGFVLEAATLPAAILGAIGGDGYYLELFLRKP
ncbi:MAG: class I SAM-dependent methyltransferase [Planctomycetota bacterium]